MFKNDPDHLDQHFLVDNKVINKFMEVCDIKDTDIVIEIGPGDGTITKELAKRANKVIAFEIDERLKDKLSSLENKYSNLEIIYANALNSYIPKCNKIVTALPYSIIEPFINKLIKCDFEEVIMIMGSKYVNSVTNEELTKLSILTNCYFKSEKQFDITPESFNPKPRVLSSVMKLKKIEKEELVSNKVLYIFRQLYFRKLLKIKKSLMEALIDYNKEQNITLTKKESKEIINKLNIPEELLDRTFESISNSELEIFYNYIKKC